MFTILIQGFVAHTFFKVQVVPQVGGAYFTHNPTTSSNLPKDSKDIIHKGFYITDKNWMANQITHIIVT